jgi:alpha-D-xyloside xylohydrolase
MPLFSEEKGRLIYRYDAEKLWIEPWGENSLRVRATKQSTMPGEDWALTEPVSHEGRIEVTDTGASVINGKIKAVVSNGGWLVFYDQSGKALLQEYARNRRDVFSRNCSALEVEAREFRPILTGDYQLTMRFESLDPGEKLYGMGQYQQPYLDIKGADLELAQRNSQASVPFVLSSRGYGFLWNNPAVGRAVFGKNITSFEAVSAKSLDYWVTAGDTPAEIEEAYASVTGKAPMMPDYAMGFWQCKLRYQTQEELLGVAREYKKRGLPVSVIVVDYFHWPKQGDWMFDPTYWPDPDAMIRELKDMGMELMVSIWPTVDSTCARYEEMLEKGYLVRSDRGVRMNYDYHGQTTYFDATNPEARKYIWDICKKNYYDKGIQIFWLDEAEPEYRVYDFDNYRYDLGPTARVGNVYPLEYARAFHEGMEKAGQKNILNLLRCAWAGSQKYGALVWSGDVHSSFESLRNQFAAGLNMGIAGIPWWTTDIGGFHGGRTDDPAFHELLVRWFEYGTFCPVMRLHGNREPQQPQYGTTGGAVCLSGAANEVWSFGEEAYEICKKYIFLRQRMKPYIEKIMAQAHKKGTPVMRPLFYDFPADRECWDNDSQYMFGPSMLVAPVMYAKQTEREVYLPEGRAWINAWDGEKFDGGRTVRVRAPLGVIPVFLCDEPLLSLFES